MRQEDRTFLHISIPREVQRRPRAACLSRCSGPAQPSHPMGHPSVPLSFVPDTIRGNAIPQRGEKAAREPLFGQRVRKMRRLLINFYLHSIFFVTIGKRKDNKTIGLCKFTAFYTHDLTHGKLFNIEQAFLRWFHDKTPFVVEKMKSSPLALSTIHSFCLIFCLNGM